MRPSTSTIKWIRVGYPEEGEPIEHGHGNANLLPHTHVGGDRPHGHRHSRGTEPGEFTDEFYETENGDE